MNEPKKDTAPPLSITEKQVLVSFYLTQLGLLVIALPLLWWQGNLNWGYFGLGNIHMWIWGGITGLAIVAADLLLARIVPERWFDDGGINRLLFKHRSFIHIFFISLIAALVEEMFFRGVVQHWLGIWWASLLFVLVHTRYLRQWLLVLMVGVISLVFGWLVQWSGTLAPAIVAHWLVDFLLGLYFRYLTDG
ncbi:CPBP family intramembrane glutamic endopeptidase [Paenactinomyces guangxiensis]|uniref:CPBP family intramembrane metalloprotease n=1 Tax=Paenactinomyces guangxiensis TaxID=1490290 RepID=A0A7W2A9V3_9BACL|nr:type II CAAX endopeptidase family protein [Paenactinomyces guangxiensis]MBA4495634.1 CPBP family intramembrane metalloprotease [Paenactinomyces guangxiensis]MBH8592622.1 CPBP family intramembrane metalloprotease [Paenactinomyces guangxiensis]